MQLLRSEKRFVEALSTVPPFIRNQEILDQLAEIKEAYLGGMELDLLIEKMQDNEFNAEAALASHHSLYEKYVAVYLGSLAFAAS